MKTPPTIFKSTGNRCDANTIEQVLVTV